MIFSLDFIQFRLKLQTASSLADKLKFSRKIVPLLQKSVDDLLSLVKGHIRIIGCSIANFKGVFSLVQSEFSNIDVPLRRTEFKPGKSFQLIYDFFVNFIQLTKHFLFIETLVHLALFLLFPHSLIGNFFVKLDSQTIVNFWS